ncbi:MAG: von Willebrand factor type A domain-containing protein [Clostridia bacterium]|nr:von Willebrand factor type A domain-containing protein [Clostridia bacterium]
MKKQIYKWMSSALIVVLATSFWACGGAGSAADRLNGANNGNYYAPNGYPSSGTSVLEDAQEGISGELNGEDYTQIIENAFIKTAEENHSYFSIDANTASYPNLRSLINSGYGKTIPKDAVRVEEMLNYFKYDHATPTDGSILALTSSVFDNPYNAETKLLTVGLAAQEVQFTQQQNNLVFLIDTSGSMYSQDKLPLVQAAFSLLTENLNDTDRVSIVTYAGNDKVALDGAFGNQKETISAVIEDLQASGSTAGSAGIETAYRLAEQYFIEGGNNRVILATDGDFNVGITGGSALENFIAEKRESGVYFSVFGVGRGNLQSSKMETLALNGNGTYSYIDSVKEAQRALVQEIGGTLVTVAKDVKAGIIFNADYIDSYRLIGYENKLLTEEEFEDDATDAGELGSGHTVTVAYEVKLTEKEFAEGENLAQVTVKYKPTENSGGAEDVSQELLLDIPTAQYHQTLTATDSFIASVIEFALILRDSTYKGTADLNALITRLDDLDLSNDEYKTEFRDLVKTYRTNLEN